MKDKFSKELEENVQTFLVQHGMEVLLRHWGNRDERSMNLLQFVRRLVAVELSYSVSAEDIEVQEIEDSVYRNFRWWRGWFDQPAKVRLWSQRHEPFLRQIEQIARDYLTLPPLQSTGLTGAIAARLLWPAINLLVSNFIEREFGPHRWFAGIRSPWNAVAILAVSAFWLAFWSLVVLTSYLFLPSSATVVIFAIALAVFWRRWKAEREWQKLRTTKISLMAALSALAQELENNTFNSGEMIRRLRELTPEFQPPSILVSLLQLEHPQKRSPIVLDGEGQIPSTNEKHLMEALDFLVNSLKSHMGDYHYRTDAQELERYEMILREAIGGAIQSGRIPRIPRSKNVYLFIDARYLLKNYKDHFASRWFGDGDIDFEHLIGQRFSAQKSFYYDDPVLLAMEMMNHAISENIGTAKLLSGDGSLMPLVESVVRLGVFVQVIADPKTASNKLVGVAGEYKPLTFQDYYHMSTQLLQSKRPIPIEHENKRTEFHQLPVVKGSVAGETFELGFIDQEYIAWFQKRARSISGQKKDDLVLYLEMVYGPISWT